METAFSYRRLSQDENKEEQGQRVLDNQLRDITDYSRRNNILILKDYNEGLHTGDEYRDIFNKMIKDALLVKPNSIIVREQNRFSRDVALTMQTIKDLAVQDIMVLSVIEGNLTKNIILTAFKAAADQYYLIRGREHQALMMERKRQDLQPFGCVPFGYNSVNKSWVINEEEANKIRNIFKLYVEEDKNAKEISDAIGVPWNSVYHYIKNPVYCGYFTYLKKYYAKDKITGKKKVVRSEAFQYKLKNIEPLISEEMFTKATKKRIGNTRWRVK